MIFPSFSLLHYLKKNAPVLCDGNKLGPLHQKGFPPQFPAWAANLSQFEQIKSVYHHYVDAGASILRTNTEGAHRLALEALELNDRIEAINNNGMALLREAVGSKVLAAAAISSVNANLNQLVTTSFLDEGYSEQAVYLADTGAQFFMLTEFESLEDLKMAITLVKRVSTREIVAHLELKIPIHLTELIQQLVQLRKQGAEFVGVQLSPTLPEIAPIIAQVIEHCGIVSVILNEVPQDPDQPPSSAFEQAAKVICAADISIVGGGRHTTPHHIKLLRELLDALPEALPDEVESSTL